MREGEDAPGSRRWKGTPSLEERALALATAPWHWACHWACEANMLSASNEDQPSLFLREWTMGSVLLWF